MANFELDVETKNFSRLGIKPSIDEEACSELLDHALASSGVLEQTKIPTVHLTPHPTIGMNPAQKALFALGQTREYSIAGFYDSEETVINVICQRNIQTGNKALAHEAKHWADDNTELLSLSTHRQRKFMGKSGLSVLGIGAVSFVGLGQMEGTEIIQPSAGILTCIGIMASAHLSYSQSEHEKRARQFARDDLVKEKFSKIISYR
jgi:hypothetical protein